MHADIVNPHYAFSNNSITNMQGVKYLKRKELNLTQGLQEQKTVNYQWPLLRTGASITSRKW